MREFFMKTWLLIGAITMSFGAFASTPLECFDIRSGVLMKYLCPNSHTKVVIPQGVTDIEGGAFLESGIVSVNIPNSVTRIGYQAFLLNELTEVIIPNSVEKIGKGAFAINKLTSVIIPDSVTEIGDFAFATNKLTSLSLSGNIREMGVGVFIDNQLTSVSLDSCRSAPEDAFDLEVQRRSSRGDICE
jgi:hypothetical protein